MLKCESASEFLREKSNFKWHLLAYVSFKYYYLNTIIYEEYFRWASTKARLNKKDVDNFVQRNAGLKNTLNKIEKSVRKNTVLTEEQQLNVFD